jgi:hypothetical protein
MGTIPIGIGLFCEHAIDSSATDVSRDTSPGAPDPVCPPPSLTTSTPASSSVLMPWGVHVEGPSVAMIFTVLCVCVGGGGQHQQQQQYDSHTISVPASRCDQSDCVWVLA